MTSKSLELVYDLELYHIMYFRAIVSTGKPVFGILSIAG